MSAPRRRSSPARRNQRRRSAPARDFWGAENADEPRTVIEPSEHPTALIKSLGPPPFPGAGLAQHYFDAIYARAAALAFALASAAGVAATGEPDNSESELES
jgi:hypothetical protein